MAEKKEEEVKHAHARRLSDGEAKAAEFLSHYPEGSPKKDATSGEEEKKQQPRSMSKEAIRAARVYR